MDIFKGQLSFTEIINMDICVLNELLDARIELLEEQEKARQEAMRKIEKDSKYKMPKKSSKKSKDYDY